jgi:phytoene synthase
MRDQLTAAYAASRRLNATHGRTFYLATWLLPRWKRRYVHALYGFARYADDIVDRPGPDPATRLAQLRAELQHGGTCAAIVAVRDTAARWQLEPRLFDDFLDAMQADLTVRAYPTYADLVRYMNGSAAAIGAMMLPILEPLPGGEAADCARDLGLAFQLTNFIRDVGEDLRRGRLYLPLEDLTGFGVTREQLEAGVCDRRVKRLLRFEIDRARELYRAAAPGIDLLHPTSRDCIRTALVLYRRILAAIEAADYPVLERRVSVSIGARLATALPAWRRAVAARRPSHTHQDNVRSTSANPKPMSSIGAKASLGPRMSRGL